MNRIIVCFSFILFQIPSSYQYIVFSSVRYHFSTHAKNEPKNKRGKYIFEIKQGKKIERMETCASFYDYNNCKLFECQRETGECIFRMKSAKNNKFEKRENYQYEPKELCESFLFLFIFTVSFSSFDSFFRVLLLQMLFISLWALQLLCILYTSVMHLR